MKKETFGINCSDDRSGSCRDRRMDTGIRLFYCEECRLYYGDHGGCTGGKTYLQSREYQQTAAQSMQGVLEAAARSSRLEKDGAYDPDRIIRIQDYVEDGTIYDDMPESEKGNGLCYRLGDLYQWSLKGAIVSNKVLNEAYKPLFFGSIQEYANQYDEEYNVLVKQIEDSLEKLQQDVTAYQQDQKNWAIESTNVRYALYDMGNGQIYTNAGTLRGGRCAAGSAGRLLYIL